METMAHVDVSWSSPQYQTGQYHRGLSYYGDSIHSESSSATARPRSSEDFPDYSNYPSHYELQSRLRQTDLAGPLIGGEHQPGGNGQMTNAHAAGAMPFFAQSQPLMVPMVPVAEGRPKRLGRETWPILENMYRNEPKPSTRAKQAIADEMGVDIAKINNWYQNRRAKTRQEQKKLANLGIAVDQALLDEEVEEPTASSVSPGTVSQTFEDQSLAFRPGQELQQVPSTSGTMIPLSIPTTLHSTLSTSVSSDDIQYSQPSYQPPSYMAHGYIQTGQNEFSPHMHPGAIPVVGSSVEPVADALTATPIYTSQEAAFDHSLPSSADSPTEFFPFSAMTSPNVEATEAFMSQDMYALSSPSFQRMPFGGFSVQNSPAVSAFPETYLSGPTTASIVLQPLTPFQPSDSSYLSPPMSRELNQSSVSLSALDSMQMPAPNAASLLKPRTISQPSLAERRRKAGPSTISTGPGSGVRSGSYTCGMPPTPRSPLPGDQTLRKVRSNGNGAGRIQKPSTPGIASPGLNAGFTGGWLAADTPPPSAPPMAQKFSEALPPTIEIPAAPMPVRSYQVPYGNIQWTAPYSAPPTQQTFAFAPDNEQLLSGGMDSGHSPTS